ncbi:amidase [Arthrobacter sp. efr-133-TYG-120]|uniref:amidase n=1 Tax=Arthrobacter sp. efr-133-TYG-120 TaxID=3040280 RepID=UPI002550ED58|nr:amidase [Arthrobacter sp. efr-133-TYG-120]
MRVSHSLLELTSNLQAGILTPHDAVQDSLKSIAETEESVRAWVLVDEEGALEQASALKASGGPKKGALWGVPVAVKDLIDVQGLPTACGSSLKGQVPAEVDAECVRLLRDAGAVVLGKTVTTEFGYFSPGPTRNPVNPEHTPGGSSSGSAAAVAAGTVPLALGTQTAGSLTRPASYCGVAGFVAAQGQFTMAGIAGLSKSLDSLGLLARSVKDLRYAWDALSGHDATETQDIPGSVDLLLWNGSGLDELTLGMTGALDHASSVLNSGHDIHLTEWTDHELIRGLATDHATVMAAEAAVERSAELTQPEAVSQAFIDLLTAGCGITDEEYHAALQRIAASRRIFLALLERFDAVLGPAALGAAPLGRKSCSQPTLAGDGPPRVDHPRITEQKRDAPWSAAHRSPRPGTKTLPNRRKHRKIPPRFGQPPNPASHH